MSDCIVYLGAVLNLHLQWGYPTMQDFPLPIVPLSTSCFLYFALLATKASKLPHMCAYSNDLAWGFQGIWEDLSQSNHLWFLRDLGIDL